MTVETWTYLGEQPGHTIKRLAVWRREIGPGEQQLTAFVPKPSTRGRVGWQYEVDYDGHHMPADRKWLNREADDAAKLQLENDLMDAELARKALERNAPRRREIDAALKPLTALAHGLNSNAREALISHVHRMIWTA